MSITFAQHDANARTVWKVLTAQARKNSSLNIFTSTNINEDMLAFRRYEDASLSHTGIDSHEGLTHFGLYDTVVEVEPPMYSNANANGLISTQLGRD